MNVYNVIEDIIFYKINVIGNVQYTLFMLDHNIYVNVHIMIVLYVKVMNII